jgi:hypothetical protein
MANYEARMLDAETGGEGHYRFTAPDDLFSKTADEIVTTFFDHVEQEVLRHHVDWELNGIMKNPDRRVVTAMGSLIPARNGPPLPFLLMIAQSQKSH